jgi:hypothetical protein
VPFAYRRGTVTTLRVQRDGVWHDCPQRCFAPQGVAAVEADIAP